MNYVLKEEMTCFATENTKGLSNIWGILSMIDRR